jgi:hypothetical protein
MKKYLFGLLGLALLAGNPLRAQTPKAPPVVMVAPEGGACCCPGATTCVPEQYMKKTTTWVFSSGCEPLCLCYYRGLLKGCDCASGRCEQPYTRRYLIKKAQVCEECATKCVPSQGAACGGGGCCGSTVAPALPAPPVMMTPAAPGRATR